MTRKISRRKFISTVIAGALTSAVVYGYSESFYNKSIDAENHLQTEETQMPTSQLPNEGEENIINARPLGTLPPDTAYLSVARGESPKALVEASINAIGGIERFVDPGDDVIIKPNICVAYRSSKYAATTNPEVIGALTALCIEAGAKRVRVMDSPFGGTPEQAYDKSGINKTVQAAGGQMEVMSRIKYEEVNIPFGKDITHWPIYTDILETDVLINVPIAKQHSLAKLTLGMKNLMGIIQSPNKFHTNLGQRIADLTSLILPDLTVVDAIRILKKHGPTGGNLEDVERKNTIIASHDIIAADAYAASLFDLKGSDIPAIRAGFDMGLGTMELDKIEIEEIRV